MNKQEAAELKENIHKAEAIGWIFAFATLYSLSYFIINNLA